MEKLFSGFQNGLKTILAKFLVKDLPALILSLSLFLGGIWILSLDIPGWSLLWGLIIIPIGLTFTVYTLDSVFRNRISPPHFKITKCQVCGKTTYAPEDEEETICARCRKEIKRGISREEKK